MRAGEKADLLILTAEAMEELQASGAVTRTWALGSSGVGVAVRAGAPRPDIGSVEALKRTLLCAGSVAHSKVGASGIYFAEILERLGIASRLKKRVVVEKGPVPGIDIVGPLPEPIQKLTCFAAGIAATADDPQGALALVELLRSGPLRDAMVAGGLQPR